MGKGCEANIKVGVTLIFIAFSYDPIKPSAARVPSSWWRNCGEAGEPRSGANGSLAVMPPRLIQGPARKILDTR